MLGSAARSLLLVSAGLVLLGAPVAGAAPCQSHRVRVRWVDDVGTASVRIGLEVHPVPTGTPIVGRGGERLPLAGLRSGSLRPSAGPPETDALGRLLPLARR